MHYEDLKIKPGDTLSKIAQKYGYDALNWKKIWEDPKNVALIASRGAPEKIEQNDVLFVPIPWKVTARILIKNVAPNNVTCRISRDGKKGSQIRWVQTVNRSNQPFGIPARFCVDPCGPPDDSDPFYWTTAEITADPALRKEFSDTPRRPAPAVALGTTSWRAIISLAVVTEKRVTILESLYWGFNITPGNVVSKIGPRLATALEIQGHLNLLKKGSGTAGTFRANGWSFRN